MVTPVAMEYVGGCHTLAVWVSNQPRVTRRWDNRQTGEFDWGGRLRKVSGAQRTTLRMDETIQRVQRQKGSSCGLPTGGSDLKSRDLVIRWY